MRSRELSLSKGDPTALKKENGYPFALFEHVQGAECVSMETFDIRETRHARSNYACASGVRGDRARNNYKREATVCSNVIGPGTIKYTNKSRVELVGTVVHP